jgi:catechol 2,3-dioxygenase-like lactoylglutathione lyase family enzyme
MSAHRIESLNHSCDVPIAVITRTRRKEPRDMRTDERVDVRYMVDNVTAAVDFYTRYFGFTVNTSYPAFADVIRGNLRLLLAGPDSSAGRPMPDGAQPGPGGWNRIHFVVDDIQAEIDRLKAEGVRFRNDIVKGPGGTQILALDPARNLIELFQPAAL